jgi:hypothetical protein
MTNLFDHRNKIRFDKKKKKNLREHNFLVHLELMIEDDQVKLEYHHLFHMCNIIQIIFPAFPSHHSFNQINFSNYFTNIQTHLNLHGFRDSIDLKK